MQKSVYSGTEGVSTYEELACLQAFDIELFQGYYFAKPAFQSLATISWERIALP